ncbi:hypothetical protein L6164_006262 [Bauhinia variegata]|uniref:Uncharacterized protein n=1 Tax=Bauhinia variegata TaxID=167791 RepID=A0ACB9PVQ4_BAUVA|nr:hypothetical protein L6164_006262 [Bauhinia variegata]
MAQQLLRSSAIGLLRCRAPVRVFALFRVFFFASLDLDYGVEFSARYSLTLLCWYCAVDEIIRTFDLTC